MHFKLRNIEDLLDAGIGCHRTNKSGARRRMSVETIHPPNEHDNISKQLDKHVCGMKLLALFL